MIPYGTHFTKALGLRANRVLPSVKQWHFLAVGDDKNYAKPMICMENIFRRTKSRNTANVSRSWRIELFVAVGR
jgi:hypothetical protein